MDHWDEDSPPPGTVVGSPRMSSCAGTLRRGTLIADRYCIDRKLGQGGMGQVYCAADMLLVRRVAIKVMHPLLASKQSEKRSLLEAQSLARIKSHPNIVAIYDAGIHEGRLFIAQEYIEGQDLTTWLQETRRDWRDILAKFVDAGRGLAAVHQAGLVHRDVKPANILVGSDGDVRLVDFGIARRADEPEELADVAVEIEALDPDKLSEMSVLRTKTGVVTGTPAYLAPERLAGHKGDALSDQFSFCLALYEALYGRSPFPGATVVERHRSAKKGVINQPPAAAKVPSWLHPVLVRGLCPEPEARYGSMDEVLQALTNDPELAARKLRRARLRAAAVAGLALLFLGAPLGLWYAVRVPSSMVCTGADKLVAKVWSPETKAKIEEAFAATGLSYAQDTYEAVEKRLDSYAESWAVMHTDACEALNIRKDQSRDTYLLRTRCLDRKLGKLQAFVAVLSKDPDKEVVKKAAEGASKLGTLDRCADVKALEADVPPPEDPRVAARVAELMPELDRTEALEAAGRYREGLRSAQALAEEANSLDYEPFEAEALYLLARFQWRTGEAEAARVDAREALRLAVGFKDWQRTTSTLALMANIVGNELGEYQAAMATLEFASLFAGLPGVDASSRAELWRARAMVHFRLSEFEQALEALQQAEGHVQAAHGPRTPQYANVLGNTATVLLSLKRDKEALEHYNRVLGLQRAALGPTHPQIGATLTNLGHAYQERKDFKTALNYYKQALQISEAALGEDSDQVARCLRNLGSVLLCKKEPEAAHPLLERAARICSRITCEPENAATIHFFLGQAVFETGGKREQALELVRKAEEECRRLRLTEQASEARKWLEEQAVPNN